ncbi:MAG TPA: hypothetical protein EYG03_08425 [Planctomycetes bacterium]|nr:hypothetical protein [Fuerstiella sp.]HIK91991.1 hypothetical protein [Planctomycetota bacterium]
MSSDKLIYMIAAEPIERAAFGRYFKKHQFNCQIFDGIESAESALEARSPDLFVLAGSNISSADICKFGTFVEQRSTAPIIALLTILQMSIVSEIAESENLWTAEYPISLREIRASIGEALEELEDD